MIFKDIEFFGVIEFTQRFNGLQLQRIPEDVRNTLNNRGRWNSQMTNGLEIRFVCDSPHIRLFLSSLEGKGDVTVYCGDFLHSIHRLTQDKQLCIHIEPPKLFSTVKPKALQGKSFSPKVWRFLLPSTQTVFHELETYGAPVRPPSEKEKPTLTWLAYGSSITAGNYVKKTARLLGVDAVNLAMGGACHCETELADFIAERNDWDFATFELGVNMRDVFSPEEFKKRSKYLINQTLKKQPGKPVFLITMFPNQQDYEHETSMHGKRQQKYKDILRGFAIENPENLHLLEGHELMPGFDNLSIDLIHPSDSGHSQIALKLAERLKYII